jgi:hypothetical protein
LVLLVSKMMTNHESTSKVFTWNVCGFKSNFEQNVFLLADFRTNSQQRTTRKSLNWEPSCTVLTYRQTRQSWRLSFVTFGVYQRRYSNFCVLCVNSRRNFC